MGNLDRKLLNEHFLSVILSRPKVGFAVPLADWSRGELRSVVHHYITEPTGFAHEILDSEAVRRIPEAHHRDEDLSLALYSLLTLDVWGRIFPHGEAPDALTEDLRARIDDSRDT